MRSDKSWCKKAVCVFLSLLLLILSFVVFTSANMASSASKGDHVIAVKGKHEGKRRWINADGAETKEHCHVILRDDETGHEKGTRVKKSSVRFVNKESRCYEESVINEHHDIALCMETLAKMLAEVQIQDFNSNLLTLMNELIIKENLELDGKGHKARYRKVKSVNSSNKRGNTGAIA